MKKMTYDVYGRKLTVESTGKTWQVWQHGADGKRRPAEEIQIPSHLATEDIESYLADLCHEWASESHPHVERLI
jgi:hypothetical protein